LPLKDLRGRSVGEKVTGWGLKILKELEGPPGGRAWFAGHTERSCRLNDAIITYRYSMSMITYGIEGKGVRVGRGGKLEIRNQKLGGEGTVDKQRRDTDHAIQSRVARQLVVDDE